MYRVFILTGRNLSVLWRCHHWLRFSILLHCSNNSIPDPWSSILWILARQARASLLSPALAKRKFKETTIFNYHWGSVDSILAPCKSKSTTQRKDGDGYKFEHLDWKSLHIECSDSERYVVYQTELWFWKKGLASENRNRGVAVVGSEMQKFVFYQLSW